ncbi:hypothetical protein KY366_04610 [Candidatus Woesearchaeota archaeon]|nr:hypothetical protein [Candidatus Woesearchaeota archaeon]
MNNEKKGFSIFPLKNRKKASLSLSVNAIVVLILAIVMLGLGLGFIRGMFGKVSTQIEQQIAAEPEPYAPTASNPITLSRESLITHSGDKEVIKVSTFNPTDGAWSGVIPSIRCDSLAINDQSANARNIDQGEFVTFNLLLTVPASVPDTYLCQMNMTGIIEDYVKDMTIKIME